METILTNEKDERFIQLSNELNEEYYRKIGDEYEKYLDYNKIEDPHVVLLVLNWGNPIACASYRPFDEDSVEIRRVYVKRRYRNKGIAYKLVKSLEKLAMEENFKYSFIETGKENLPAVGLYEKLGYETIDNFGLFENDDVCICMKKEFKTLIF